MMKVELRALDSITPYARNPRRNVQAIPKVKASLKEYGWRQPIVVDTEGVIIVGHTRYQAALELGWTEAPVHVAEGLTKTQVKAYRIADNRTGQEAEWDMDLLALEFDDLRDAGMDMALTGFDDDELAMPGEAEGDGGAGEVGSGEPRQTMAERFGIPPFSVLNAREGWWQDRKRGWLALGIKSELGRGDGSCGVDNSHMDAWNEKLLKQGKSGGFRGTGRTSGTDMDIANRTPRPEAP